MVRLQTKHHCKQRGNCRHTDNCQRQQTLSDKNQVLFVILKNISLLHVSYICTHTLYNSILKGRKRSHLPFWSIWKHFSQQIHVFVATTGPCPTWCRHIRCWFLWFKLLYNFEHVSFTTISVLEMVFKLSADVRYTF